MSRGSFSFLDVFHGTESESLGLGRKSRAPLVRDCEQHFTAGKHPAPSGLLQTFSLHQDHFTFDPECFGMMCIFFRSGTAAVTVHALRFHAYLLKGLRRWLVEMKLACFLNPIHLPGCGRQRFFVFRRLLY